MDTLDGMRVFARVVEAGSFSEAARRLGISKALASKYVRQLEGRLHAQLLSRSTRRLTLTEVGRAYYERAIAILDEVADLEDLVQSGSGKISGGLRISGPRVYGEDVLVPAVAGFMTLHPAITVDLALEERSVDIVGEGFDLAIRIGELADSGLIARRIVSYRYVLCATPGYLEAATAPDTPADLAGHACIVNSVISPTSQWSFTSDGKRTQQAVVPRARVNSARAVRDMVLAGLGIGLCLLPTVEADLAGGRLVRLLKRFEAYDRAVYAVYPPSRHLTRKVRAFIDHLAGFRPG